MELLKYFDAFRIAKAIEAAAELKIADLLTESPRASGELALATATHEPTLVRLLRALVGEGIFRLNDQGQYENTNLSETLRCDHPDSIRDIVLYLLHDGNLQAWMRLLEVLKTGKPSFRDATGQDLWSYLAQRPKLETHFNQNMAFWTADVTRQILDHYDFSRFQSVADIGGGQGYLIASLLQAYPEMKGVVVERESVAEEATDFFRQRDLSARAQVVAGDFFGDLPVGHDAYTLKYILHDWGDEDAVRILRACRAAMPDHGKLLIFETVMGEDQNPHPAKWIDLHMLVIFGGKERTTEQFRDLLAQAGFSMTRATPLDGPIGIIEADPA